MIHRIVAITTKRDTLTAWRKPYQPYAACMRFLTLCKL